MDEQNPTGPFGAQDQNQGETQIQNEQLVQIVKSTENMQDQQPAEQKISAPEYAGFWVRFAAQLLDSLILIIPNAILIAVFKDKTGEFFGYLIAFFYSLYMLNAYQATLGKMALGIKVTRTNGDKASLWKLAARELPYKILSYMLLGIGFIMIAFTKKKQGLHDMLAGTVVVYDPQRKRRE